MQTTNWHNVRMIALVVVMFIIGGLQLIQGMTPWSSFLSEILPILIFVEHQLQGNSGTPTS